MRHSCWTRHNYFNLRDQLNTLHCYLFIRSFTKCRNNVCTHSAIRIHYTNQHFFNNIEQTKLKNFIHRLVEINGDYTTILVCFPLCVTTCLLNNKNIAIITSKSRSTIATTICCQRLSCVKQTWVVIWHKTSRNCVKFTSFYTNTKFSFPLKRYI